MNNKGNQFYFPNNDESIPNILEENSIEDTSLSNKTNKTRKTNLSEVLKILENTKDKKINKVTKTNEEELKKIGNQININLANVRKIREFEARKIAKEKYTEMQNNTFFLKRFFREVFFRHKSLDNLKQKELDNQEIDIFREKLAYASIRKDNKINQTETLEFEENLENNINGYINYYIDGKIDESFLKENFYKFLEKNYKNDIKDVGTDLLLKLRKYKELKEIVGIYYFKNRTKNDEEKKDKLIKYMSKFENKELFSDYMNFDLNIDIENLHNILKSNNRYIITNLKLILEKTFEIKIYTPTVEKTAYELDYTKSKNGNDYKTGEFIEKKPFLTAGLTSAGLALSSGIPVFGKFIGGSIIGNIGAVKRYKQYIDNHEQTLERISFSETDTLEEKIKNLKKQIAEDKKQGKKSLRKKGMLKYYENKRTIKEKTTHENIVNTKELKNKIDSYIIEKKLDVDKIIELKELILEAIARIEYGKEVGTTFLKSDNFEDSEKDLYELMESIKKGLEKIELNKSSYSDSESRYFKYINLLKTDFQTAKKNFERQGKIELAKGLVYSSMTYFISSYILQELINMNLGNNSVNVNSNIDTNTTQDIVNNIPTETVEKIVINEGIEKDLNKILGIENTEQLQSFLENNKENGTLWDVLIVGKTKAEGNTIKNQIVEIILNSRDTDGSPKLFTEAINGGILDSFKNNDEFSQTVLSRMKKWGYNVDNNQIMNLLNQLQNSGVDNLGTKDKIILSEVMFNYLDQDKEKYWEQIKNILLNKVIEEKIITTPVLEPTNQVINTVESGKPFYLDMTSQIGFPAVYNKYMKKIIRLKDDGSEKTKIYKTPNINFLSEKDRNNKEKNNSSKKSILKKVFEDLKEIFRKKTKKMKRLIKNNK